MKLKGIIFDFDGLISSSEYLLHEVINNYFTQHYNIQIDEKLYSQFVGLPDVIFFKSMKDRYNLKYNLQEIEDEIYRIFNHKEDEISLMPGVKAFVKNAKKHDLRLSIATSNMEKTVEMFLKKHQIDHYFDFILGQESVENIKPNPEVYLKSVDKHNQHRDSLLVLEDSYTGYQAAKNAGLEVLMVLNKITKHLALDEDINKVYSFEEIDILGELR